MKENNLLNYYNNNSEKGNSNELVEILDYDEFIKKLIGKFSMEEKETNEFIKLIKQGEKNNTFYILSKGSKFKLEKNGSISEVSLDIDTIIGETTLLQYLNGEKTSATASVEIKGKYYEVSFEKFKEIFDNLSESEKNQIISFLKYLENKRKNKTKPISN